MLVLFGAYHISTLAGKGLNISSVTDHFLWCPIRSEDNVCSRSFPIKFGSNPGMLFLYEYAAEIILLHFVLRMRVSIARVSVKR